MANTTNTHGVAVIEKKPFYKSKIVWLAVATIFLGAVDQLNLLSTQLPVEYQGITTMVLGALTLLARSFSGITVVKDTTEK